MPTYERLAENGDWVPHVGLSSGVQPEYSAMARSISSGTLTFSGMTMRGRRRNAVFCPRQHDDASWCGSFSFAGQAFACFPGSGELLSRELAGASIVDALASFSPALSNMVPTLGRGHVVENVPRLRRSGDVEGSCNSVR